MFPTLVSLDVRMQLRLCRHIVLQIAKNTARGRSSSGVGVFDGEYQRPKSSLTLSLSTCAPMTQSLPVTSAAPVLTSVSPGTKSKWIHRGTFTPYNLNAVEDTNVATIESMMG